jgi:hypothetical protein
MSVQGLDAIGQAAQARAGGVVGAPDPVVGDLDARHPPAAPDAHETALACAYLARHDALARCPQLDHPRLELGLQALAQRLITSTAVTSAVSRNRKTNATISAAMPSGHKTSGSRAAQGACLIFALYARMTSTGE